MIGMNWHWILDGHTPIKVDDMLTWSKWFSTHHADRIVAQTETKAHWISTVFLGINYQFRKDRPPLLFETMVFPSRTDLEDLEGARYATWDEAAEGHYAMVRRYEKLEADAAVKITKIGIKSDTP